MKKDLTIIKYLKDMRVNKHGWGYDEWRDRSNDQPFVCADLEKVIQIMSGAVANMIQSGRPYKKEIVKLFKTGLRNLINQRMLENTGNIEPLSKLVDTKIVNIETDLKNIVERLTRNTNPGNIGMCIEFLTKEFLENGIKFMKFSSKKRMEYFLQENKNSVCLSMAWVVNEKKTKYDIKQIINDEELLNKLQSNLELYRGILGKNINQTKEPQLTGGNTLVSIYEVDYISDNGYIIDFKCSFKKKYESIWLYQLLLYYFILLKQGKRHKGIMCFNPVLGIYWKIDMEELVNIEDTMEFLTKNRII